MKKLFRLLLLLLLLQQHVRAQSTQSGEVNTLTNAKIFAKGLNVTAITVDDSGTVWAGTNQKGLYYASLGKDTNSSFQMVPSDPENDLNAMTITSIAADRLGNVWVGHASASLSASSPPGGGLKRINANTFAIKGFESDRNAECFDFYSRDGLPTYNISGIAVDKYNTVWTSHRAKSLFVAGMNTVIFDDVSSFTGVPATVTVDGGAQSILTPGSIAYKRAGSEKFIAKSTWLDYQSNNESPELPYPAYTCNADPTVTPGSRRCEAVACSKNEVWLSVYPIEYTLDRKPPGEIAKTELFPSRILRYDLNGLFLGQLTLDSVKATPGGVFNSIYLTESGDAWISLSSGKGFAAKIHGCWTLLNSSNLPTLFPTGSYVNAKAIWGNKTAKNGQVFIGTNNGLIVYNGVGKVDDESSYSLLTTKDGLASNNITGGASQKDSVQWVATDAGIVRLFSRNDFSVDSNYTSCKNKDIDSIEAQASNNSFKRSDYHIYKVETTVCTKDGPNGKNCNAQYVYNMMKEDVTLQAPTPEMFPEDNLKALMMVGLTEDEKMKIEYVATNWDKNSHTADETNKYGGIKTIRQLLDIPMIMKYYCPTLVDNYFPISCLGDGQIPFLKYLFKNMKELNDSVLKYNDPKVVACKSYRLYNSPNFIADRSLYKINDLLFCEGRLTSIYYDLVKIFPDNKNLTITNYTTEGHLLHPGKVHRMVIEECGTVKVVTVGNGLNYCAENLLKKYLLGNEDLVASAILQAKMNGNGNIITGTILFKNIDMKLKDAFKNKK